MRRICAVAVVCALSLLATAAQAMASEEEVFGSSLTNSGGNLRTGWYPNQSALSPELVEGGTFGKLWTAPVKGQVYAQPLLDGSTLFVATEENNLYGLNPQTGAQAWTKSLGEPWNPGEISCADLAPKVGVTATPVIDQETNVAYLTYKTYGPETEPEPGKKVKNPEWFMDAVSVSTGAQEPGFPVQLSGSAQNAPGQTFEPKTQLQRPGLLLMGGVVYAAFGSDCDTPEWQGWVFGVSTEGTVSSGGAIKARWVADESGSGAGIWQSGAGLTSDGPGTILVSTGNGGAPSTPTPGDKPPGNLGESIVRLDVQPDGSLKAVDFFAPYNATYLDSWDADFASGGVTALPESFGTLAMPHLAVAVGKDGYVYLLNRDNLGGIGQGSADSDDVVQRIGPYGGVWSRPGVWPGEGGWVYIPTASGGTSASGSSGNLQVYEYGVTGAGTPTLSLQGTSSEAFGFSSSAPIVTSNGTEEGSALVWIVWAPNGGGVGAELRAYKPVPVKGQPVMVWSESIGTSAKFATPGVGGGRLYVGTRDEHVIAFGSPVTPVLSGSRVAFGTTTIGDSAKKTLTLTATEPLMLSKLDSSSSQFTLGTPSLPLPAQLTTGQTIEVPITFSPAGAGPIGGTLTATTSTGKTASFGLSGIGETPAAKLEVSPIVVTFDGTAVGEHAAAGATFRNVGGSPLTIEKVKLPAAPFGVEGPPAEGTTIEPGHSITVTVTFNPTEVGAFNGEIALQTSAGNEAVGLSGAAGLPGALEVKSEAVEYGPVAIGASESKSFIVTNTGGTAVGITKSKPPIGGVFEATTSLSEGTTIAPGESLTETVKFTPTKAGAASADWPINGKDTTGLHDVRFNGVGIVPEPEHPSGKTLVPSLPGSIGGPGISPLPEINPLHFRGAQLASTTLTTKAMRMVGVRVSCPAGASGCAGTIALRIFIPVKAAKGPHAKGSKKPIALTIAEGTFAVAGGRVSTVELRLSRRARALLARAHVLRAQGIVTSHDPAGDPYTAQESITIRA
ncbi:MAG: choice-of-anchor D domain-containing protein [Solirubrobacteraceae bacterium]